jgi:16S rRNA (uracil1498-N3)-methyltransferase
MAASLMKVLITTRLSKTVSMSLPFFYEPAVPDTKGNFVLSAESSKHLVQVLRMRAGDQLMLTNGMGSIAKASLLSDDKKAAVVLVEETEQVAAPSRKITLAISLLKNASRLEWLLEKVTEMGITCVQPLICERTSHERFRHDRMQGILISAMLQSQQAWLPELPAPVDLKTFITQSRFTQSFIAHCEPGEKKSLQEISIGNHCAILIGPEGDFSNDEISTAIHHNWQPVSLGTTRLRTETAGIVASALLVYR